LISGRGTNRSDGVSQELLVERAKALGVELGAGQVARLDAYLDAMLEVNLHLNLTSVRNRDDAVVRHLLDSLSVVPAWHALAGADPPRSVLDLGTGGGFPGAVLAVAWPGSRVLMVDSTGKKVRAVAQCLAAAGIANAETRQVRGEQMPALFPETRCAFDLCVARAVAPAPQLVRELAPLVAPGGFVLLMKGDPPADEVAAAEREAARRGIEALPPRRVDVPGLDRRTILAYVR
jgi:16S rRNA (guanine527-N7)-methyltransferase